MDQPYTTRCRDEVRELESQMPIGVTAARVVGLRKSLRTRQSACPAVGGADR